MKNLTINELITENVRLQQKVSELEKELERKEKCYSNLKTITDKSISEYEARISFYDHKYPLLHYEYEQYLEDIHQHDADTSDF